MSHAPLSKILHFIFTVFFPILKNRSAAPRDQNRSSPAASQLRSPPSLQRLIQLCGKKVRHMPHRADENAFLHVVHIADRLVYDPVIKLFMTFQSGPSLLGKTDADDSAICIIADAHDKPFFFQFIDRDGREY